MQVTNLCKKLNKVDIIAISRWAKKLDAEECTIHSDGTVSLYCKDGCICENYLPSGRELNGK